MFNRPRNSKDYNTDLIYTENLFNNYLKAKLGKEKAMLKVKQWIGYNIEETPTQE